MKWKTKEVYKRLERPTSSLLQTSLLIMMVKEEVETMIRDLSSSSFFMHIKGTLLLMLLLLLLLISLSLSGLVECFCCCSLSLPGSSLLFVLDAQETSGVKHEEEPD